MTGTLGKLVGRAADRIAIGTGRARRHFTFQRGQARVLTYHGLVPDELADRPWVPSHFVTVSQFERQMAGLTDLGHGVIQPLGDVAARLRAGISSATPAVCLTFDDGTADNVSLALPILQRHGFGATFFLTTGPIDRGELLPNDMIRLLREAHHRGRLVEPPSPTCRKLLSDPRFHKSRSLCSYRADLQRLWAASTDAVDPAGRHALRMMTWDDARCLRDAGMEIGAHTVNHAILAREDRPTRRREIAESIARVREETGQPRVPFAYPNGLAGDYDEEDVGLLASLDVPYAVTGLPGWNDSATPLMELKRSCVGLHGSQRAFLVQVFGLRDSRKPDRLRPSA